MDLTFVSSTPTTLLEPSPPPRLTLRAVQEVLQRIEDRYGLMAARRVVAELDYEALTTLARSGGPDDDPDLVDPRYLLLWGMKGERVLHLQRGLYALELDVPRTGDFDDATLTAYRIWRGEQTFSPRGARS